MKRLLYVIIAAALLWSGYWAVGAVGVKRGIEGWMAARRAEGWQAEATDFTLRGYPNRFDAQWRGLVLADPETGFALDLPRLGIYALSYRPHHAIAVAPPTLSVQTPYQRFTLENEDLRASLRLHPGPRLELARARVTGQDLVLSGDATAAMAELSLAMDQSDAAPERYRFGLLARDLALPPALAARLGAGSAAPDPAQPDPALPDAVAELRLDADVAFTRPWDLRALQDARPQPTRIQLHLARAEWGELLLQVSADLQVDRAGRASGEVQVQARNWRRMLDMAVTAGVLTPGMAESLGNALSMMAGMGGNPQAIDLPLTLRDGRIWAGLIPLGPAPRLYLR